MKMSNPANIQLQILNRNLLRNNINNNDARYPLIHMRDHLFHTAFVRLAVIYARMCSVRGRKIIEFLLLSLSFLSLVLLIYIHMAFVQTPSNCLAHVQDKWPRDGILRVEILREKLNGKYSLEKSYLKERKIREMAYEDLSSYFFLSSSFYDESEDYTWIMETPDIKATSNITDTEATNNSLHAFTNNTSFNVTIDEKLNSEVDDKQLLPTLTWSDDEYIMEFSLEYGFLKLNPSVRKEYNITVELVTLDPNVDECFGGRLNNFILYNFLGYDEVLLASLKLLASKEEYKGYVRNIVTEVEFIFVNAWMDRKSYITAGFVMMVFTVSISILLRYSHHQIFVFIVELLHMLEFHSSFNFPAGPLLTVILALVGMEAIMSEFFNDTAIAFYVILIVWMADQYDTICCKSVFTKKHWLRFFYLYHFFFYAYSYRFGHNRFLALMTSWLFTIHSMVYFFHRYELPILVARHTWVHNPAPPGDNPDNNSSDPNGRAGQGTQTPDTSPGNVPQSETDTSISSSSDSSPYNNRAENSTNGGGSNPRLYLARLSQTVEAGNERNYFQSCEKNYCEASEYREQFHSKYNKLKNHKYKAKSVVQSQTFKTVVLSPNYILVLNLLLYLIFYSTLILLFKNIFLSPVLRCFPKRIYSSTSYWKFMRVFR